MGVLIIILKVPCFKMTKVIYAFKRLVEIVLSQFYFTLLQDPLFSC